MKRFVSVLRLISGILVALVALVFTVLEATLLLTLDFNLYEHELLAFIQLVLRFTVAAVALALGVLSLIKRERSFFPAGVCLLAASVVMIPFVSNNFGLYFTAVSALFVTSHLPVPKNIDER